MEEPVIFKNKNNQELYGIAHIPSENESRKKIGIIFLNPGPGYRTGHNRLYVILARKLSQKGFYCLRFDPAGLGESEGEVEEAMLFDLFTSINQGRFVHDTIEAANFFIEKYELRELILTGLCGGAMTALLAAPHCQKVSSLILMGFPVLFSSLDIGSGTQHAVYARRTLRNCRAWIANFNVISLDSYRGLIRKIKAYGLYELAALLPKALLRTLKKDSHDFHPHFNKLFMDVLESVSRDIKIGFIFGEHDRWRLFFEVEFEQKKMCRKYEKKYSYRKFIIKEADHLLSSQTCQKELLDVIEYIMHSNKLDFQFEGHRSANDFHFGNFPGKRVKLCGIKP
ncbi:MAG: alpha/beta hydrolase [bacterium]